MSLTKISLDQLDQELNKLRKASPREEQCRAFLFTLIIYTTKQERSDYFSRITASIVEKFPCRIIFIRVDTATKNNYFNVTVSKSQPTQPLCENIHFEVGGTDVEKILYAVLPILLPDLPIYLLWGDDPSTDCELLKSLMQISTRTVFDSEFTPDMQQYSGQILALMKQLHLPLMDMQWAHTNRWREVLTKIFESEEDMEQLKGLSSFELVCNDNNYTQGIFFQAWLAICLHWQLESISNENHGITIHYRHDNKNIIFKLTGSQDPDLFSGSISRMTMVTKNRQYEISRMKQYPKVIVHVTSKDQCQLPFTLPMPPHLMGLTFLKEIFYAEICDTYKKTLTFLSSHNWGKINE